jgi:hypothetical protein
MDSPDSPDGNLLDWDEELVCFWLDKNGFASHQDAIRGQSCPHPYRPSSYSRKEGGRESSPLTSPRPLPCSVLLSLVAPEHGITGDVLALLSSDDMRDLGISSLGHRLGILKLVYQLKIRQGIPLEEGCWLPARQSAVPSLHAPLPCSLPVQERCSALHALVPIFGESRECTSC